MGRREGSRECGTRASGGGVTKYKWLNPHRSFWIHLLLCGVGKKDTFGGLRLRCDLECEEAVAEGKEALEGLSHCKDNEETLGDGVDAQQVPHQNARCWKRHCQQTC